MKEKRFMNEMGLPSGELQFNEERAKEALRRVRERKNKMNESVIIESNRDDCPGMLMHEIMGKLKNIGVKSEILYESEDSMEVCFSIEKEQ